MNNWSYFDSNMNQSLIEQRKVLRQKNYEIDSRAHALQKHGYAPFFGKEMQKRRGIDDIIMKQKKPIMGHEHLVPFKHNYTSITKYQKSLINSKMCGPDNTGMRINNLRPNLNYS